MKMPREVRPYLGLNLRDRLTRLAVEAEAGRSLSKQVVFWQNVVRHRGRLRELPVDQDWAMTLTRLWRRMKVRTTEEVAHAQARRFGRSKLLARSTPMRPAHLKERMKLRAGRAWGDEEFERRADYTFIRASCRAFELADDHCKLVFKRLLPAYAPGDPVDWQTEMYIDYCAEHRVGGSPRILQSFTPTVLVGSHLTFCSWVVHEGSDTVLVLGRYACNLARRQAWTLLEYHNSALAHERHSSGLYWQRIEFGGLPDYMRSLQALADCLEEASLARLHVDICTAEAAQHVNAVKSGGPR